MSQSPGSTGPNPLPGAPIILAFVADIILGTRVETTAAKLGFRLKWIGSAREVSLEDKPGPDRQPAEHLVGPGADLIDLVSKLRPALMIFDLGNSQIPWTEWIPLLKSAPATRRYPLIVFGAHVDAQALTQARHYGADSAVARSHFIAELPVLIEKHARVINAEMISQACSDQLSEQAIRGIELFNHGEYFEAHELLELAWNEDQTPGRELYRAILQVAVAYLQIERGNYNGAVKMFLRVRQWIDPLPAECRGVNVEALRKDASRVHEELLAKGREGISRFDRNLMRPVQFRVEL